MSKLSSIEQSLTVMLKSPSGGKGEVAIIDSDEASYPCSGSRPVQCNVSDLSAKEFAVYRYGGMLLKFLTHIHGIPPVRSLLAKSIPKKESSVQFAHNAFSNSFHFDEPSRTVFVRIERAQDVGKYSLLLVHCISHLKVDDWSDLSPKFGTAFYKSLHMVLGELFFSRVRKQTWSGNSTSDALQFKELRQAFSSLQSLEDKDDILKEFIDLHQVSSSQDALFAPMNLFERLNKYTQFSQTKLKSEVESIEKKVGKPQISPASRQSALTSNDESERLKESVEKLQCQIDDTHEKLLHVMKDLQTVHSRALRKNANLDKRDMGDAEKEEFERLSKAKASLSARLDHLDAKLADKTLALAKLR